MIKVHDNRNEKTQRMYVFTVAGKKSRNNTKYISPIGYFQVYHSVDRRTMHEFKKSKILIISKGNQETVLSVLGTVLK